METARVAFARPGYLDTVAATPIGAQPGAVLLQHVVNELLMHACDLAAVLGETPDLPDELYGRSEASWAAFFAEFGRPASDFAAARPAAEQATAAERLGAYLGR